MPLDKDIQQNMQLAFEHLNKQYNKSIHKVLLMIGIRGDELALTVLETGEQESQYKVLGEVEFTVGTGELLDQIVLSEIIEYISQDQVYEQPFIEDIVQAYSWAAEDLDQIKDEKVKRVLKELKRKVHCMKYILSNFEEMTLEVLPGLEKLIIDQEYFEEEFLEELELRANIKMGINSLIQEMNKQNKKWGIDEILLVGRTIQMPYIKQIIRNELISRGVASKKIFDALKEEPIYTIIKDLYYLGCRTEEEQDRDKLLKIIYQGRTYEYVKKELNQRTNKEEITLRYNGKAIEKYPAEKEKYFKPLPYEMKSTVIVDFQVAVLDEGALYAQLNDKAQLNEILKLSETNDKQFIAYFTNIETLLNEIQLNNQIRYVLIAASNEKYMKHVSSIQQVTRNMEYLQIKIPKAETIVLKQEVTVEEKKQEIKKPERNVRVQYEVEFNSGYYAYFGEYHQVDCIDRSKGIIEEKYINQLKKQDRLIFVDNMESHNKNIIMYIIERTIKNNDAADSIKEDYQLFMRWKDELESYIDRHGYDVEQIAIMMEEYGVTLTPQAISQWLPDGRTIAPQSARSLEILIDIIGSRQLKEQRYQAYEASKNIRQLHRHIKKLVEEIILKEVTHSYYYYTGVKRIAYEVVKDFKSYSKILEVKDIKRVNKKVKSSQVNKILKD